MKITKLLFVFAIIGLIAVSCKETKKEDVVDESAVEMTEEGSEATDMEATDDSSAESTDATPAASEGDVAEESAKEAQEGVEAASKDVEEVDVEGVTVLSEEMADTPVIYPGCAEGSVEEIRACSKKEFIAFLKKEFDKDLANELSMGNHEIRSVVHIDESGKCSVLRVTAPNPQLKREVERVIGKLPQMTAATKNGKPVSVTFILPVNFKVDKL
ncbi:MAG: hypothetical protein DRI95_13650 [Bacteroidetes bacterium]|nr:MAG: hypothetical protein DRI95_13650 [Bacteroidota bacterium]